MADIDKLLTEAGERWRAGQPAPPTLGPLGPRPTRRPDLGWAVVAAVLVVALAAGAGSLGGNRPTASFEPSLSPVAMSTEAPSALPAASLELVDGIPVAVEGQPVLVGQAANTALRDATVNTPMLIGGWLHPFQWMSCPAVLLRSPSPWNPCDATRLFPSPFDGPEAIGIYRGLSGAGLPTIPDGGVQAVVLRVHTHDPACATGAECKGLPVLETVVWQGGLEPTPMPTSSAPPAGLTLPAAVGAATRVAGANHGTRLVTTAAVAGPYAIVGPTGGDVAGDRWVWAITVVGRFPPVSCSTEPTTLCLTDFMSSLIVLDYVDGSVLISSSPAPVAPAVPDSGSRDAMTIVSKFELARALANWDEAWRLLAPMSQKAIGSEARYIELETAYNAGGGGFEMGEIVAGPFDAATTDYIGSLVLDDFVRSGGTVSQVHLVYVRHPDEAGASASSSAYLVALVGGDWRIWIVH
jgi:hypothetical protein